MTESEPQSRAILVLGMHRSGTSAVTRVLNLLGVELGSNLLPAAANNNETGFWEHAGVVEVHDALLRELDRSWHDLRPLPDGWLCSDAAQMAKARLAALIEADLAGASLWAVKDPRLCRLLPLWRELLAELEIEPCVVRVLRHPDEVARSLRDRDGFPLELGRLLWLEHITDVERDSRGWRRCIISYDDLLSDWQLAVERAGVELAIHWPVEPAHAVAEVETFLNRGQRHHAIDASQGNELPALIQEVYDSMRAIAQGTGSWDGLASVMDRYHPIAEVFARGYDADIQRSRAEVIERVAALKSDANQRSDAMLATLREMGIWVDMPIDAAETRSRDDCASLYWCGEAPDAFDESRKVTLTSGGSPGDARLVFHLPGLPRVSKLRIDPSVHPGRFDLLGLRIDRSPVEDFAGRVECVSQLRLAGQGAGHVAFLAMDDDPHADMNVADLAVDWRCGVTVEVHVLRHELPKVSFDEIWQRVQGGAMAACASALVEHGGNQLQSIENLEMRLQQFCRQLSVDMERHLDASVAGELNTLHAEMRAIESRLTEQVEELLQRSNDGHTAHLEQFAQRSDVLEQYVSDLSASLRQQMERLDSRLDADMLGLDQQANAYTMTIVEQLRVEERASKLQLLNRLEELLHGSDALHSERLDALSQGVGRLYDRDDGHSAELAELRRILEAMDKERRRTLLQRLRGVLQRH